MSYYHIILEVNDHISTIEETRDIELFDIVELQPYLHSILLPYFNEQILELDDDNIDILGVQETKSQIDQIPKSIFTKEFNFKLASQSAIKGRSGTALFSDIEPFFEYKQWSYRINEEEIYFTEGIFFKRSVTIPIVRIQNINLSEGPINRKFNLADVNIGTAGGSYKIPNLDKEEVEKIREFLKIKINENIREELDL